MTVEPIDLGVILTWPTPPQLPNPPREDTEIVGRLRFLLREIAHKAADAGVPADLAGLIGQAQAIADGDLPQWQQGRAA